MSEPTPMTVQHVPVDALTPDPDNLRRHPQRQLDAIARSLTEFGQRRPLVTTTDGIVIAGNGTLEAAKQLGWDTIAITEFPSADRDAVRRFAIADNRTADLAEWDEQLLADTLQTFEPEALADIGFTTAELDDLIESLRNPFEPTRVNIAELHSHQLNYQQHPDDQIEQLMQSITMHGFYRNVIVARDNTILAGHGVVEAARRLQMTRVPVVRMDLDPDEPRALKVLVSDNEINNLAAVDDRALTDMLKMILDNDDLGLDGSGFTQEQLAALAYVTRPPGEITDPNQAGEWVGLPEYDGGDLRKRITLTIEFETKEDRERFAEETGIRMRRRGDRENWTTVWPWKERRPISSVKFGDEHEQERV